MKNVVVALVLALGLPFVGLFLTFVYLTSPRWSEADYDNLITYEAYPPGPAKPETLTVVTYNVGYFSGLANQQPVERDRPRLEAHLTTAIEALESLQPDILGLQEIDFEAYRSFNLNQQYALSSALGMPYAAIAVNWDKRYVPFPYWPPQAHFKGVTSGQAVLSRYPIRRNERLVLPRVPTHNPIYGAFYLDRLAQVTEIDVSGQPLLMINVHLEAFDQPTRRHQTELVRQLAEQYAQRLPVLLVGDFNSDFDRPEEADNPAIDILLASPLLASALPPRALAQPQGATFPADQPQYTLDYIFYTPASLELLGAEVVSTANQASDHLPLQAQLRFRRDPPANPNDPSNPG